MHLDALLAVPLAGLATSSRPVEAESARAIPADFRVGEARIQLPDVIEDPGVRGRVRGGGRTERLLIHDDHLVDVLEADNFVERSRDFPTSVQVPGDRSGQCFFDERTLSRT